MSPGDCLHHSLILDLLGAKMDLVYVTVALARQFIPSGVIFLKGCVQQARKWLFRPKFFSLSKWAQFLHVTLDLTGKRCPVIFSAVLFFVFEKFSSTSTGGKCALRWFYCLEKQKLSLERTPPGKKLRFCIRYLWKMKEKPANLNRGLCFSIKWKATCRNWAHLDEEKQFRPKKSLTSLLHARPIFICILFPRISLSFIIEPNLDSCPVKVVQLSKFLYYSLSNRWVIDE